MTDEDGFAGGGQVRDFGVGKGPTFTPFSNLYRAPGFDKSIDFRGHSVQFDVDLGNISTWPDASSLTDYTAGNAAEGSDGTTFVVRIAGTIEGGVNLSNDNGLRLVFFKRDGQFFYGVKNLWVNQEQALPQDPTTTKYRIIVSFQPSGAFTVKFLQLNGVASGASVISSFAGGSTDQIGATAGTVIAQMVNKTHEAAAQPTKAVLSNFQTDAVPNVIYVTVDNPFLRPNDQTAARLWVTNPTSSVLGYQAFVAPYYYGLQVLSSTFTDPRFTTTYRGPRADASGIYVLSQTASTAFIDSSQMAMFGIKAVSNGIGRWNFKRIYGNAHAFITNAAGQFLTQPLLQSPGIVVDSIAPQASISGLVQNGLVVTSGSVKAGSISVKAVVADDRSGILDYPTLLMSIDAGPFVPVGSMGSLDPINGIFQADAIVPSSAKKVTFEVDVFDRCGNKSVVRKAVGVSK